MTELCRRYAAALYDVCPDEEALRDVMDALDACPPLRAALESPAVSPEEKGAVVDRVFAQSPVPLRLLLLRLCRRGRLGLLPRVAQTLHGLILARAGAAQGVLRTAVPMDAAQQEALAAALAKRQGLRRVELRQELDPALLGGFTLEVQGVTYDRSLRGSIGALRRTLERGETNSY